jgi:diguanylate cyclase (GGDEF)-like protein
VTRVVLVTAVCVVMQAVWSGLFIADVSRRSERAGAVATQIQRVASLADFRAAFLRERTARELDTYVSGLGLDITIIEDALGFSIAGELAAAEREVDALVDVVVELGSGTSSARTAIADLRTGEGAGADTLVAFDERLEEVIDLAITDLEAIAPSIGAESDVVRRVRQYQLLSAATDASGTRMESTAYLIVPSDQSSTDSLTVSIAARDRAERALDDFVEQSTAEERAKWAGVIASSGTPGLDEVEARLAAGGEVGFDDPMLLLDLGKAFGEALLARDRLRSIVPDVSDAVRVEADRVVAGAERERTIALWLTAGVSAAMVLLGVAVGRSIARPLRTVERRAIALSNGEMAGSPLSARGPRDVATVAAALNDASATLGTIERQLGALAAGDLDHADLSVAAPGSLGAYVHASVERLSGAMAEGERLRTQLHLQATHDSLTGCLNRRVALEEVEAACATATSALAVLFVDLDGFKSVNDEHGHGAGDTVLVRVAERIRRNLSSTERLFRLGGDEFVVLALSTDEEAAVSLGARIRLAVAHPIATDAATVQIDASIGVAMHRPGEELDAANELIRRADVAVYHAKSQGRGRVAVFGELSEVQPAR